MRKRAVCAVLAEYYVWSWLTFARSMVGVRAFFEDPANEAVRDFETLLPTVRQSYVLEMPLPSPRKRYRSRFTIG